MTKCSNCKQDGHNKKTCKTPSTSPTPSTPPTPKIDPMQERFRIARENADRLVREEIVKEEAERIAKAEAERIAKAEAERIAREKRTYPEIAGLTPNVPIVNNYLKVKSDPILSLIFEILYDKNASMEYMMLREYYAEHPEQFRMLGTEHLSNEDTNQHVSFEVRRTFVFKKFKGGDVTRVWSKTYHLYYIILPSGQRQWTDLKQQDRNKETYVLASFYP
jgi:hypothetical protein